jgi:hypothetical protein
MSSYQRLLVIANETIAGKSLHERIRGMVAEDGTVTVVAPALSSKLEYVLSDVDGPREHARERLDKSLELMAQDGIDASGEVGDANPVRAFKDAVAVFHPDAVIVSTHPEGRSHWLENQVVEKIEAATDLPVTHVVVDMAAQSAEQRIAAA